MRKQNTLLFYFGIFLFLAILLLIFGSLHFFDGPTGFISKILTPMRSTTHKIVYKSETPGPNYSSDLEKLKKENKALSDQFQITNPKSSTLVPSNVIGSPSFIPGVTF